MADAAVLRAAAVRASRHGIHEPARVDAEVATKARDVSTILTERAAWARLAASASAASLKTHGFVPASLAFNSDLITGDQLVGHDNSAAAARDTFHREMDDELMFEWDA